MNIRPTRALLAVTVTVSCLVLAACSSGSSSTSSSTPSTPATSPASSTPGASASASPSSSSSSSSASLIPASLTGTAKTVATNWVAFFNPATPTTTKETLLENGTAFASVLQGQASSAQGKESSAQVTAVTISGSLASVTWNLLIAGSAMLNKQKGQAVLTKGVWQVSDASFCGLLSLQPPVPAACKS